MDETVLVLNLLLGLGSRPAVGEGAIPTIVERTARQSRGHAPVVWVSNEVGSGNVTMNPRARRFADFQGLADQRLVEWFDAVLSCVADLSFRLK